MTELKTSVKALLLSMTKAQREQLDLIEALAKALPDSAEDALLGVDDLLKEFKLGRGTVQGAVERGELTASRGARGKILVARSEVERWIASRPYKPGPRRVEETDDGNALEEALASGELVRGGCK
jgi:hypothetical protein